MIIFSVIYSERVNLSSTSCALKASISDNIYKLSGSLELINLEFSYLYLIETLV